MLWSAYLLLLAAGWMSAEPVPSSQIESLLLKAAHSAEKSLSQPRPLPDIAQRVNTVFLGFIPLEFGVVAKNVTQVGPMHIVPLEPLRGEKSTDGKSLFIKGKVRIKKMGVIYNYLLIDIFGYKYEGTGSLWKEISTADLTLQFQPEDVIRGCTKTVSVLSRPLGQPVFYLGLPQSAPSIIHLIVQVLCSLFNAFVLKGFFTQDLQEFLFPDEQDAIMNAFNNFTLDC